jgi:hypothetical protein
MPQVDIPAALKKRAYVRKKEYQGRGINKTLFLCAAELINEDKGFRDADKLLKSLLQNNKKEINDRSFWDI